MTQLFETVKNVFEQNSQSSAQANEQIVHAENVKQDCNYSDNYYGDQYCKPCEG